jgi:hypothetical protein
MRPSIPTVVRRAWRTVILCGGVILVGCSSHGSFQVSWTFTAPASGGDAAAAFSPGDCGKAGVSAIAVTATNIDSDLDDRTAACAPGTVIRQLAPGTWNLALVAVDAEGHVKEQDPLYLRGQPQGPIEVVEDQLVVVPTPVFLQPLPQCRDGIDNDCDGRVDLDDPQCDNVADGASEGTPPQGQPCYTATP